jgi:hypothetical protein
MMDFDIGQSAAKHPLSTESCPCSECGLIPFS